MNNSWSVRVTAAPNVAVYPPGARFGPRVMGEWEFVWLLEGDAIYRWSGKNGDGEIEVPQGHLLLCQPDTRDEFEWDKIRRTRHGFFHFALQSAPGDWSDTATWLHRRALGEDDICAELCRHILTWSGRDNAQIDAAASLLLAAFVTNQTRIGAAAPQRAPEAVERALAFLYARLDDDAATPIELHDLARAACVTPEHLCRLFKSATGLTPLQTVKLARLDRAALLLGRSNYSVGEVARLCGFASPFHFSRVFKENYGFTPRQLRERAEAGQALPTSRLLRLLRLHGEQKSNRGISPII